MTLPLAMVERTVLVAKIAAAVAAGLARTASQEESPLPAVDVAIAERSVRIAMEILRCAESSV